MYYYQFLIFLLVRRDFNGYDNMSFDVIISENTISIGKKQYKTERNLINVLSNILTDYEEYTIN